MWNFALVSYDIHSRSDNSLLGKLSHWLSGNKKISTKPLKLMDSGMDCALIKIPYSIPELKKLSNKKLDKLQEQITHFCLQEKIEEVIYPGSLTKHSVLNGKATAYSGRLLYLSLLIRILNEIFTLRGIKLSNLDIAFIHGDNYQELYSLVWFISPFIKYLTIVTEDKDIIMKELEKLCEDTGLSVRLTNDLKNGLVESDVIINLLNFTDFNRASRIKTKAIVINYNNSDTGRLFNKNELINGIEIKIPDKIRSIIPEEVQKLYTSTELSEIILVHKEELGGFLTSSSFKIEELISLDQEFERLGFKLSGFVGRYGFLSSENIVISSTKSGKVINIL